MRTNRTQMTNMRFMCTKNKKFLEFWSTHEPKFYGFHMIFSNGPNAPSGLEVQPEAKSLSFLYFFLEIEIDMILSETNTALIFQ